MTAPSAATLFDPARHEPLAGGPWDAGRARQAIRDIVADLEQQRLPEGGWRVHPNDEGDDGPSAVYQNVYLGAAGVLWALWCLQRGGAASLRQIDPTAAIAQAQATYRAAPDEGQAMPSFYLGEAGIALVHWRLTGSAVAAEALHAAVRANIGHPAREPLWGAPGTMGAAWHLWAATGEARWRKLFIDNVAHLFDTWEHDAATGCPLWTQQIHGGTVQYLGAGHGFAGNVRALLQGAALLDDAQNDLLHERCVQVLQHFARHGEAADAAVAPVNWLLSTTTPRPGRPTMLMQWCHGAPGIVTSLCLLPPGRAPVLDELLEGAGHAIWQAGPLNKGPGLCHGTAGNAAAFLMLHRRTGAALWIERARAFAMHAIAQCEAARALHGRGRPTLYTGDAGLAIFLWQCLGGTAGMPLLDVID